MTNKLIRKELKMLSGFSVPAFLVFCSSVPCFPFRCSGFSVPAFHIPGFLFRRFGFSVPAFHVPLSGFQCYPRIAYESMN